MFEELKKIFGIGQEATEVQDVLFDNEQLSIAALLVHAMIADGETSDVEVKMLQEILIEKFDLEGGQVDMLIEAAKQKEQESIDLFSFTRNLKASLNKQERLKLVEDLWQIVLADGIIDEFEDNIIWRLADLLSISREERIALKLKVKAEHEARSGS